VNAETPLKKIVIELLACYELYPFINKVINQNLETQQIVHKL
jgi:hypothetical protein